MLRVLVVQRLTLTPADVRREQLPPVKAADQPGVAGGEIERAVDLEVDHQPVGLVLRDGERAGRGRRLEHIQHPAVTLAVGQPEILAGRDAGQDHR